LRASQIQTVLTNWVTKDPTAALNAVQSTNLTDTQRANLVQTLAKTQAATAQKVTSNAN
jgi:hypothetical protein